MTKVIFSEVSLSDFFPEVRKGVTNVYYDAKKNRVKTETYDPTLSERCWHDHHTMPRIKGQSLTIKKDATIGDCVKYQLGKFCSYECMLAYALAESRPNMRDAIGYITQEFMEAYPDLDVEKLKPAPPYEALEDYGGNLTIAEFRKGNHHIKQTNHFIIVGRSLEIKDD